MLFNRGVWGLAWAETQIAEFEAGDDTLSNADHFRYLCRIPQVTHPFFVPK